MYVLCCLVSIVAFSSPETFIQSAKDSDCELLVIAVGPSLEQIDLQVAPPLKTRVLAFNPEFSEYTHMWRSSDEFLIIPEAFPKESVYDLKLQQFVPNQELQRLREKLQEFEKKVIFFDSTKWNSIDSDFYHFVRSFQLNESSFIAQVDAWSPAGAMAPVRKIEQSHVRRRRINAGTNIEHDISECLKLEFDGSENSSVSKHIIPQSFLFGNDIIATAQKKEARVLDPTREYFQELQEKHAMREREQKERDEMAKNDKKAQSPFFPMNIRFRPIPRPKRRSNAVKFREAESEDEISEDERHQKMIRMA